MTTHSETVAPNIDLALVDAAEAAVANIAEAAADLEAARAQVAETKQELATAQSGKAPAKLAHARAAVELAELRLAEAESAQVEAGEAAITAVVILANELGRFGLRRERELRRQFVDGVAELVPAGRADVVRCLGPLRTNEEILADRFSRGVNQFRAADAVQRIGAGAALERLKAALAAGLP